MGISQVGSGLPSQPIPNNFNRLFKGYHYVKLDSGRKRFSLPYSFRKILGNPNQTLLLLVDRQETKTTLRIYPENNLMASLDKVSAEKRNDILAVTFEIRKIDQLGRILIPSEVSNDFDVPGKNQLVVVGRGDYMEVIHKEDWKAPPLSL